MENKKRIIAFGALIVGVGSTIGLTVLSALRKNSDHEEPEEYTLEELQQGYENSKKQ